jgi:3-phenylpropionate/trans-cinnamate dioxygenase ferredoxin reductase subunit
MQRNYPYLIIGGGIAADAAVRGIRMVDTESPIGLIGEEPDPPYNRPPLSKGLWKSGPRPMPLSRIWRGTANLGVDLHLGHKAIQLDPAEKRVVDNHGNQYSYGKLLLATGGDPIRMGVEHERIIYFRTLADYHRLRSLTGDGQRFAVIGGGFIGSEIAAALAGQGKEVTMIFPENGIGAHVLPSEIASFLSGYYREHGIRVLNGHFVQQLMPDNLGVTLTTDQGEILRVDGVVAGLGIRPNTILARQADLVTGGGINVDTFLRTSQGDIFAAGDVANFYNPTLKKRLRAEHEENANLTGQIAGQNMAGESIPYQHLPSVYSSLFDMKYDAVGELDPNMEILFDWQEPLRKGAAFYMAGEQVRGVLLWNLPRGLETARRLITDPAPSHAKDLCGRITE